MNERRALLLEEDKGILYNLVVTDNLNGDSGAASSARVTVKYTKDGVTNTLGTNFKNGDTFLIPNNSTNVTVTGGSVTNFAPTTTSNETTYTVTYKALKITVNISNGGTGCTVTLKNITKGTTIQSSTYSYSGYIAWGDSWEVTAAATTSKYPSSISPSSGTANSDSASVSVTYTSYTLITSGTADLGLPSGKLWSATNVGASNYYSGGNYFSWGNIDGHAVGSGYNFSYATYKSTTGASLTGDIPSGNATYDAARANMGGTWRVPTYNEILELRNSSNTTWVWCTLNSTNGRLVVSKTNSNAIFLPAAGYYYGSWLSGSGTSGHYWSTRYVSSGNAYFLVSGSSNISLDGSGRDYGRFIRAIKDPEAVDLGNGVKWATGNLTKDTNGNYKLADNPWDYGAYFSWGDTEGHRVAGQTDSYNFNSVNYNNGVSGSGHNLTASFTSGDATYDAARAKLGGSWRVPTKDELNWLKTNCTWNWKDSSNTDYNGVAGYEVVGTNSNKIFLPFPGYWYNNRSEGIGKYGLYWDTLYSSYNGGCIQISNESGVGIRMYAISKEYGCSIRPVR